MSASPRGAPVAPEPARRIERESVEFGRVAGLSDGIFAIAMTLLVLGLEVPDVGAAPLVEQLLGRVPNLIAFALGFALVANVWWFHHKFVGQLAWFDPTLKRLNLLLLGLVALAPFPTGLVGIAPLERAAVVPFVLLFMALNGLSLVMVRYAQAVGAWRWPLTSALFRWVQAGWLAALGCMVAALLIALWLPVGGLVAMTLSGTADALITRNAPRGYREWA